MGNCSNEANETIIEAKEKEIQNQIKLSDFILLYPIGRSGFGRVWKVQSKKKEINIIDNNEGKNNKTNIFALKEKSKAKISLRQTFKSLEFEHKMLKKLNHKLICNMYYAFQDTENLYMIMDYFSGGDLRYLICHRNDFIEREVKFITACIALTINYLHKNNVIHRDLKPEKFIFGKNGYLHLTGFGVSLKCKKGETVVSKSGTPGYMAPETIINKPHNFSVDYYALGIIIYELMLNERPYKGNNRQEIKEAMFKSEVNLDENDIPSGWDINVKDLINGLLKRNKKYRLGNNGFDEIKNHPWLKDIKWDKIENNEFPSPFIFEAEDNFDKSYCDLIENDSIYEGNKQLYIDEVNAELYLKDFYFNSRDKIKNEENKENEKKIKKK